MEITLKNGLRIERGDNNKYFPALQEVIDIDEIGDACEICPLADVVCHRNNPHDCETSDMFSGFYCDLDTAFAIQDQLQEAHQIIKALLGAPPPRTWKKWPNIYKRATEFLKIMKK